MAHYDDIDNAKCDKCGIVFSCSYDIYGCIKQFCKKCEELIKKEQK